MVEGYYVAWKMLGRELACMWVVEHYEEKLMDRNGAVHTATMTLGRFCVGIGIPDTL